MQGHFVRRLDRVHPEQLTTVCRGAQFIAVFLYWSVCFPAQLHGWKGIAIEEGQKKKPPTVADTFKVFGCQTHSRCIVRSFEAFGLILAQCRCKWTSWWTSWTLARPITSAVWSRTTARSHTTSWKRMFFCAQKYIKVKMFPLYLLLQQMICGSVLRIFFP